MKDRKEYFRQYRLKHKEELNLYKKSWRESHKESVSTWNKDYNKEWRSTHKEYSKLYNIINKDKAIEFRLTRYCKDYTQIENYDKAKADNFIGWHCHHRDEIRELPSGMIALRSATELKENDRYYNCPPNELIFLTNKEHARLHAKYRK